MITRQAPRRRDRHGPGLDCPPNDYAQIERMLDTYGVAYVCANPGLLLGNSIQPDLGPDRPHLRLDRMLASYRVLAEIYAPHSTGADRPRSNTYQAPSGRYS